MKFSIITVVYNGADTIRGTIESVLSQNYKNIEYIIIDGSSTDGTQKIVKSYGEKISKFVSEKDNGLYDAMNKGIALATGDVLGILNSDDLYYDNNIVTTVVEVLKEKDVDAVYGDMIYFKKAQPEIIVRHYKSSKFKIKDFERGIMPGHASFFARKKCYDKYGGFDESFKITADFDLLLRFLYVHKISAVYIPKILIKMSMGGVSTSGLNNLKMNNELLRICKKNSVKTNLLKIYSKYLIKVFEFIPALKS
jgi:glycosyltransferase involved in cell wall biosynthesis